MLSAHTPKISQGDTHTHSPAYQTAQMADRRSGRHTYTQPCLPDRTDGSSPVRETHIHTALPTRPHRWQIARHTYTQPCLPDRTDGRSPVRETHIHTALPTRPHRWQIAGQGDTHTHSSAYQTAQMADRRSRRHTCTQPCLPDRTDGRSPVRETHIHTALPTRPHRWQIAGQGDTHTHSSAYQTAQMADRRSRRHTCTQPCLPDRTDGRSPVRETHIHTALPTRPHRWQIAGQGDTHTHSSAYQTAQMADRRSGRHTYTQPCLPDRTDGRSPVRETHIHTALPTRPHRWQIAGQGNTHTHSPAYQTAQMADRRSGRHSPA